MFYILLLCSSTDVGQRETDDECLPHGLLTIESCRCMLTCTLTARGDTECGDIICEFATADYGVLMDQARTTWCREHAEEQ